MPRPDERPIRVSKRLLSQAKNQCCLVGSVPNDWDDWFPEVIPLRLETDSEHITVRDVVEYANRRVIEDDHDPLRFVEAAQCLLLLHYLGSPPMSTIVETHFTPYNAGYTCQSTE